MGEEEREEEGEGNGWGMLPKGSTSCVLCLEAFISLLQAGLSGEASGEGFGRIFIRIFRCAFSG